MARDRTSEFIATVKSMAGKPQYLNMASNGTIHQAMPMELRARKSGGLNNQSNSVINQNGSASSPLSNPQSQQYTQFARFMGGSRSIARDLYLTFQKLEKINLLAQKKTIFDDEESSKELNELVYIVKQDIQSLNQQIEQLRQLQLESQTSSNNTSGHNVRSHTKNVVLTLQQQLASISSSFKSTLELRTKNMKKVRQRREQFTNAPTINAPLISRAQHQQQGSSLSHSNSTSNLQTTSSTVIDLGDGSTGHHQQDHRGHRHNNSTSLIQTQTLLQFPDQTTDYLEERANTMQSIESTIVELGTIFNQLATMVQQQEEVITRIDANVTDTMMNVEQAHDSLLQYLTSVTNNRWLIIKVFAVLFIFFLLFVLFAA